MDLHVLWFGILGVLLTGYAILDGFDLGVGILHPFSRGDHERRVSLNSIGPLWDGNEVWLVTFGGGLFGAFPEAYATILSGFYLPIIVLLFALIGRAISIEFRSKYPSTAWRTYWDYSFFLSSIVAVFLFGVVAGNAMAGMPIGADHEMHGSLGDLLGLYPLSVGLFAIATAAMHGAIYLHLKTEGALHERTRGWMWRTFFLFLVAYALVTLATFFEAPHALTNFRRWPAAWIVVLLNVLAVANIPRAIHLRRPSYAFLSSSASIAALVFLFGMALFPNLAVSSSDEAWNLTVYNAASTEHTLTLLSIIALLGAPLVLSYTAIVYWVFRGKVKLSDTSY